jgi:hypothetical protein
LAIEPGRPQCSDLLVERQVGVQFDLDTAGALSIKSVTAADELRRNTPHAILHAFHDPRSPQSLRCRT